MGNFVATVFKFSPELFYHALCGPSVSFCLFSESPASSLAEAQSSCSEINSKSWPVELLNTKTEEVFVGYIDKYSIRNVILNAEKKEESWYWIKEATEVVNFENMTAEGDLLVYRKDHSVPDYWIVCMTECKFVWKDMPSLRGTSYHLNKHSDIHELQLCKDECEAFSDCSSVDLDTGHGTAGCWMHGYPYRDSELTLDEKSSHHVIDRTTKTVENCIGDYEGKQSEPILIPLLIGLGIILALLVGLLFCVIYWANSITSYTTESSGISS